MNYLERSTYVSATLLLLALLAGFFMPGVAVHAKVLYEHTEIGTSYDLFTSLGANDTGYLNITPQFDGNGTFAYRGGGVAYEGTAEWFRVKPIAGLPCHGPFNISLFSTDGNPIGNGATVWGREVGPYCDFQIVGPNRTNQAVGFIAICVNYDCDGIPSFVLDGSPKNPGYIFDGTMTIRETGGWAFQICDAEGCDGGFGTGTTTASSTDPGVGTTTATSTATSTVTGASSVLFLPGIMGSRLYEGNDICEEFVIESERWFSTGDCAQLRLLTDAQGNSINEIYTKNDPRSVINQTFGLNLYKSFFDTLESWKQANKINDYALIPYDWRLRLDDILLSKLDEATGRIEVNTSISFQESYIYTRLRTLVENSQNGKVTIVTHSNGGLVAKALLAKLEAANDPLLDKIDNLILVASPQVGTPDTVMGMLHGTELGLYGIVVSRETSRKLLNTMPFAFHLLPNDSYFAGAGATVDTPVITFEQGTVTTPWATRYGVNITDAAALGRFMGSGSGRLRPETFDLNTPEVVGQYLFDTYTKQIDTLLNTWTPPETLKVTEIAGVGIETVSGITYFTDTECVNRNLFFRCTEYAPKLGMRPNMTIDGDGTVVTPSALAMDKGLNNVEQFWINLEEYNQLNLDRVHKDIFEVDDVSNLVANTILATTSYQYKYLSETPPVLPDTKRLTFTLHSPLDLQVRDSRGVVSSTTQSIEGGIYRRFGEIQYVSLPDEGLEVEILLNGLAAGSFTLEVATVVDGVYAPRDTYTAIPSGTSTKATLVVDTDTPPNSSLVSVDYDGNGTSDIAYDTKGEVVPVVTYDSLLQLIQSLEIKPIYKKLLLENARLAQRYDLKSLSSVKFKRLELVAIEVLKQQVYHYHRKKILSTTQKDDLTKIINELSK
jgi:hypothetical protein